MTSSETALAVKDPEPGTGQPTFEILKPGVLSTVQDCGRIGDYVAGIPPSGAQDLTSFRLGSVVVGNSPGRAMMKEGHPGDAGIEVLLRGLKVRVLRETVIAVAGAGVGKVNGEPFPSWTAVRVKEGDEVAIDASEHGLRSYLIVAGGLDVPMHLGSRSLLIRGKIGGVEGRILQKGDVIAAFDPREDMDALEGRSLPEELRPDFVNNDRLRVILGPQDYLFTDESVETFLNSEWTVTPVSDRMAYRIAGPKLEFKPRPDYLNMHAGPDPSHIVLYPVPVGGIQVPSGLQLLIMGADGGSIGGFAEIASVISPDLSRMGQMRPNQKLRFVPIDDAAAIEAVKEVEDTIRKAVEAVTR